jgi:hypothetical protein
VAVLQASAAIFLADVTDPTGRKAMNNFARLRAAAVLSLHVVKQRTIKRKFLRDGSD